jgi:hypothetical protein
MEQHSILRTQVEVEVHLEFKRLLQHRAREDLLQLCRQVESVVALVEEAIPGAVVVEVLEMVAMEAHLLLELPLQVVQVLSVI